MTNLPKSNSEEERNFLRGCLLVTNAIPNGLRTFLQQKLIQASKSSNLEATALNKSLQSASKYDFQQLLSNLEESRYIQMDGESAKSVKHLTTVREEFLRNSRKEQLSGNELESLQKQVVKGYMLLKLPLDMINNISKKSAFSDEEELTIHEQLSKEKITCCQVRSTPIHIVERPKEVSLVLNKLKELRRSSSIRNSTIYICGDHGCGKRELAKQVALDLFNQHINTSKDPVVVMVLDAQTEDSLLCSYIRLAKDILGNSMHIKMAATSKGLTTGQKIRLLKCIIEVQIRRYSNWVVIINNVNHMEQFSSYWPKPGSEEWGCGQIIVTSIDSIGDQAFHSDHSGHVTISHGMQPSEAIQVLCKVSGVANKNYALEVAEMLEFEPLALNCAASFVKNLSCKNNEPWKTYMGIFQEQKNLHGESLGQTDEGYDSVLCLVAMNVLIAQLCTQHKEIPSVLFLLSIFDPFPVSRKVVLNCFKELDNTDVESVLQTLQSTPLVDAESQQGSTLALSSRYCIKNNVIKQELTNSRQVSLIFSAIISFGLEMKNQLDCSSLVNDHIYYRAFISDVLMSRVGKLNTEQRKELTEFFKTLPDTTAVDIFVEFGIQCQLIQRLENAKTSFELAKEILGNVKKSSSLKPQLISVLRRLGDVSDMGSVETRGYLEDVLKLCTDANEADGHGGLVAEAIDALGDVNISSGETVEARKFYMEALEIRKKDPDSDNMLDIAISWFKLGNVLAIEGAFEQAKGHYEKAINIWDAVKPNGFDYELIKVLTCAGAMSVCVNDFGSAQQHLDRAMTIEERLLSPYHPHRLNSIKNAANACKALGDNEKAENLLKQSLEISEKVIGSLGDDIAQIYSELGSLRAEESDWKAAIEYYSRSLEILENSFCQLHPNIADSCCDLANAYTNFGDLEKAKIFLERSLGIRGLLFKANHPDVGTSYFRLGEVYNKLDDHETGLSLLERAVEIRARNFGIDHPDTLASIKLLGNSFARLGQLRRAKDLYQTVYDEQSKLLDKGTDLAQTASSLAEVSLGLGEVDAAKDQYRQAIEIQRKVSGDDHPELARPLVGLALVHEHCKEIKQAKTLLEKALVIYRKSLSNHSKVIITEMHLKRVIAKLPQLRCLIM